MALCEKILIVGFSGAGKSTLLKSLKASPPPGWVTFDDLDESGSKEPGSGTQFHRFSNRHPVVGSNFACGSDKKSRAG